MTSEPAPTTAGMLSSSLPKPTLEGLASVEPAAGNVVVPAIHTVLGMNPLALHALADRLAQPGGAWRACERREPRRWLYGDSGRCASEAAR
ncbi:MAG: hypothetical protein ACK51M_14005 [Burkholderiales bacterium]